jgi:hypothetical protein
MSISVGQSTRKTDRHVQPQITNTVITACSGSIVLIHANDAANTTPAALDFVYQARTLGYDILTADRGYAGSIAATQDFKVVYSVNTDQK